MDGRRLALSAFTTLTFSRLRRTTAAFPSITWATWDSKLSKLNGVRKPREPRWNAMTGGTLPWNSEEAYSRVPSPPGK